MLRLNKRAYPLHHDKKYLLSLLNRPSPTIFEIGCNDGSDTKILLEIFPEGQFHCFDPEPRVKIQFQDLIKDIHCRFYGIAIGESNREATFFQSSGSAPKGPIRKDWDLSGSLNMPTGHHEYSPWVKFKDTIIVPVWALDLFVKTNLSPTFRTVDLLWLDVQGGEKNVMKGGRDTLKRTRYIYTEFSHWKKPLYEGQMTLEETMEELGQGWKPIAVYEGYNLLAKNRNWLP